MKKFSALLLSIILTFSFTCYGCDTQQKSDANSGSEKIGGASDNTDTNNAKFDPYATENNYDIDTEMFEKRDGVDYGTVLKDVTYY